VLFAECKTLGLFDNKDFERMAYVAKIFPGAVLVFCTLRKSLTSREIAKISGIAKRGRKYWKAERRPINPVLILTGNELLSAMGPPYCWEDSLKQKFSRANGLIEICDATQQIYPDLPSWQDVWHKKRDKRSQRMRASFVLRINRAPMR
jgi:hypothetical protein